MRPKDVGGMANSVDPDQIAQDLGLECLLRMSVLTYRIITVAKIQYPVK